MTKGRLYDSRVRDHVIVHLGLNISSSAHNCGCVVDGGNASIIININSTFIFMHAFYAIMTDTFLMKLYAKI